jgi:tRNA-splicing ligase RtcB
MPIGGVLATKGVVIPNAVGVDIGCGMCAVETSLKAQDINETILKSIIELVRERIPVGFNHHKTAQIGIPYFGLMHCNSQNSIVLRELTSAEKQLGTLGGGNHFIEVQADEEDNVWVMIHSGSRNLGKKVADHYNKVAKEINARWYSSVDPKWDLAFLPIETQEAKCYMEEMHYCVDFALANRLHMMNAVKDIFMQVIGCEFGEVINIAHNYAAWENHFGENVIVHRKGAIRARKGEIGIVPGSMGTSSYIVRGLGSTQSFNSCSHGAGRKMSRTAAKKSLTVEGETAKMEGIVHGLKNVSDLDEAPGAYKDIVDVMKLQEDLVEPIVKLRPLAVVKG